MTDRISEVVRNTNETKIRVRLNLDGTGQGTLNTGIPFLDHMIDQIKRHGLFDIDIHCDSYSVPSAPVEPESHSLDMPEAQLQPE